MPFIFRVVENQVRIRSLIHSGTWFPGLKQLLTISGPFRWTSVNHDIRKISAITKGFGHEDWDYFKKKYPKTSPEQCLNINFYDPINEQPIHLVADSPEMCDKWKTFLEDIRRAVGNLSKNEKREIWLHQKFQAANSKSRDDSLSDKEMISFLESVGIDVKKRKLELQNAFSKTKVKGQLEYNEVSRIYNFMIIAQDVENLFNEVSSDKK